MEDFQVTTELVCERVGLDDEQSLRVFHHGFPSHLACWHFHDEYELHLIVARSSTMFAFLPSWIQCCQAPSKFQIDQSLAHYCRIGVDSSPVFHTDNALLHQHSKAIDCLAASFLRSL